MIKKIYQLLCDHKKLAIETIDPRYAPAHHKVLIEQRIVCYKCGKEIVPAEHLNKIALLLYFQDIKAEV